MPEQMTVREMRLRLRRIHGELEEITLNIERLRRAPRLVEGVTSERRSYRAIIDTPRSPFTHSTSKLPDPEKGKWEKAYRRLFHAGFWLAEVRRRVLSAEEVLWRFDPAPGLEPLRRERRRQRRRRKA